MNSACSTQAVQQQGPKGVSETNPTKESEAVILFALTRLFLPLTEYTHGHDLCTCKHIYSSLDVSGTSLGETQLSKPKAQFYTHPRR